MSMMVSRDGGEPFGVPKIHKWAENVEYTLSEWAYESVLEHFGVDEVSELTLENINEVQDFVDEEEFGAQGDDSYYDWVLIGFRNLINEWENIDDND